MIARYERVTNCISRLAAQADLTDAQLATRAGVSRSHLNRIKNGRATPNVDTAVAIAHVLGKPTRVVFALRRAP